MKKLLILKTGSTFPSIKKEHGDFEDFIVRQMEMDYKDVTVNDAVGRKPLPDKTEMAGVVITGSHSMVSDKEPWSENLVPWLRELPKLNIPVLGICYGHQLLAHAFGGNVGYHPGGKEFGMVKINLTSAGKNDKLLNILGDGFTSYAAHSQTVLELPHDAVLLAKNNFEKHHSFSLGNNIWGVQFHPEFNAEITRMYIEELNVELTESGIDTAKLLNSIEETSTGELLLKRFLKLLKV